MSYESGRYWCRITGNELGETSNGNPQVVIRFSIQGRVNPDEPNGGLIACEQGERTIFRVITDKTAKWVAQDLAKLGYNKSTWACLDPSDSRYVSLAGTEFEAVCSHEQYNGELKERWNIYNPSSQVKPLDKASVRKLDALFGKQLKEGLADAKSVPPQSEYSAPAEVTPAVTAQKKEDIPF